MENTIDPAMGMAALAEAEAAGGAPIFLDDHSQAFLRPGVAHDGRNDILAAAAQVFTEKGFASASIDDIADRLGATKGRVYHYYRSKTDLFLDLQRWAMQQCLDRMSAIADRGDLDPPAKLHAMAYEHLILIVSGFGFMNAWGVGRENKLVPIATAKQREVKGYVIALRDRYESLFASVIKAGIAAGDFEDLPPRLLTKPLLGAMNWLMVWYDPERAGPDRRSLEELARMHASFVVNGLSRRG